MASIKKYFLFVILSFSITIYSFTQEAVSNTDSLGTNNMQSVNNPSTFNRTALRFLEEARRNLLTQNWASVDSLTHDALQYDSSIADLYYIQAISLYEQGKEAYNVIPLLEQSLNENGVEWYIYNKDAARILLARLYVDVKRVENALTVLNEVPVLNTSDAMLTRAKAQYVLGKIDQARELVFNGANQYPLDTRFDELFYIQEYSPLMESQVIISPAEMQQTDSEELPDLAVNDIQLIDTTENQIESLENSSLVVDEFSYFASFFNKRAQQFSTTNTTLLLHSAIFSENTEDKNRLLRAWNAQGEKHPLYAIHALKSSIIDEEAAFEYMLAFFSEIELTILQDFIGMLKEESVIEKAHAYFSSYEGSVLIDTDDDLHIELTVQYKRGRPLRIEYDENQDGLLTWSMLNDYGEPKSIELFEENLVVEYGTWPYVRKVSDNAPLKESYVYNLVADTFSLPVIDFIEDDTFKNILSLNFYTPVVLPNEKVETLDLFNASYLIDFATTEYQGSRGRFTLLDGVVKSATYTQNEMPYAFAHFQGGVPVSRNVDRDNNGSYEVIEIYAEDDTGTKDYQKLLDEVFGFEHVAMGQYIQKIYVDLNNDGFDDFSEEYVMDGATLSTWDSNGDGNWDIQFIQSADKIEQEIQYMHPLTNTIQSVQIENGIPILANGKPVTVDSNFNFYWIGENLGSSYAEQIMTELSLRNSTVSLTVSDLLWNSSTEQFMRIVGIKNGDMYFGEIFYE